jgi:cytochrome c-type biogenesis protein CcmF
VSREGAFVLQNLLLIGVVAVVFWGTVLPLVSGMLGQERVVGAPYYEKAAGPLFLAILALMAVGPLLPWRALIAPVMHALKWPAGAAAMVLAALLISGVRSLPALLAIPFAAGAATTSMVVYWRAGLKLRRSGLGLSKATAAIVRKRRRYGAYLAHLGMVVLILGIAGSHFWQAQKDVVLKPGDKVSVAGYTLTYVGAEHRQLADHTELVGAMRLGDQTLQPARASYAGLGGQSLTHVAISSTPIADVYVVLAGIADDGSASFRIFVNPLVAWIWAGGAIIILGVVLGNVGERRRAADFSVARVRTAVPV